MKDINSIFLELKYEISKIELANAILDSVLFIFLLKLLDLFFGFSAFSLVMFTLIFLFSSVIFSV